MRSHLEYETDYVEWKPWNMSSDTIYFGQQGLWNFNNKTKTDLPVRKSQYCTMCEARQHSMYNTNKRSRLALFLQVEHNWSARGMIHPRLQDRETGRQKSDFRSRSGMFWVHYNESLSAPPWRIGLTAGPTATGINIAPQLPYWQWRPNEG